MRSTEGRFFGMHDHSTAHTVCIGIETERGRRHCVIHKASERIAAVDVRSALVPEAREIVERARRPLPRDENADALRSPLESR
jgi:hypothetical protein